MAMWQPSVLETYGEEKPDYLGKISGPLREKYPDSMGDRELIESLTKVKIQLKYQKKLFGACALSSNLSPETSLNYIISVTLYISPPKL